MGSIFDLSSEQWHSTPDTLGAQWQWHGTPWTAGAQWPHGTPWTPGAQWAQWHGTPGTSGAQWHGTPETPGPGAQCHGTPETQCATVTTTHECPPDSWESKRPKKPRDTERALRHWTVIAILFYPDGLRTRALRSFRLHLYKLIRLSNCCSLAGLFFFVGLGWELGWEMMGGLADFILSTG